MKIEFKEIVKKIFRDCFWLLIVLIAIFQLWHFHGKTRKNRLIFSENLAHIEIKKPNNLKNNVEFQNQFFNLTRRYK